MSRNEMNEPKSQAREPETTDVNPKQPSADWVRGKTRISYHQVIDKDGTVRVIQEIEGGEWVQLKRLAEDTETTAAERIPSNVRLAYEKFTRDMKAGESVATRTLTDGTKLQVRLSQPDALVLNIEVPGFEQLPSSAQRELQELASRELAGRCLPEVGTIEKVPVACRLSGDAMSRAATIESSYGRRRIAREG